MDHHAPIIHRYSCKGLILCHEMVLSARATCISERGCRLCNNPLGPFCINVKCGTFICDNLCICILYDFELAEENVLVIISSWFSECCERTAPENSAMGTMMYVLVKSCHVQTRDVLHVT